MKATRDTIPMSFEERQALLAFSARRPLLSDMASNTKTAKGLKLRPMRGRILHLASHDSASRAVGRTVNVCPLAALNGCAEGCLDHQGRARFTPGIPEARVRKTALYFLDRERFMVKLRSELDALQRNAERAGELPVARLDGTSDLGLAMQLASEYPGIQFYDYTKVTARALRWARMRREGKLANLHVTYSLGAGNRDDALDALAAGVNVAVVFRVKRSGDLPETWQGFDVIDGDDHDWRFLDPSGSRGVVVGLRAKGTSIGDESGFVQEIS